MPAAALRQSVGPVWAAEGPVSLHLTLNPVIEPGPGDGLAVTRSVLLIVDPSQPPAIQVVALIRQELRRAAAHGASPGAPSRHRDLNMGLRTGQPSPPERKNNQGQPVIRPCAITKPDSPGQVCVSGLLRPTLGVVAFEHRSFAATWKHPGRSEFRQPDVAGYGP